jgi:hypothetical protein
MSAGAIATFTQSLRGPVFGREHPEYDEARKLYNAILLRSRASCAIRMIVRLVPLGGR